MVHMFSGVVAVLLISCADETPTALPSPTPTATSIPTPAPTFTHTPIPTPTFTPRPTATPTPTPMSEPTATPIPISTPTAEEIAIARLAEIIPWVAVNPPDSYHLHTKENLTSIWLLDANLGAAVARLPWLKDGVDSVESSVTLHMARLASADTDIARMVASLPSFSDDITATEVQALGNLTRISHIDHQLAESIVGLPWFSDDITATEAQTLRGLTRISHTDPQLAESILELPQLAESIANLLWFNGQITFHGDEALRLLARISHTDPQVVELIVGLPWFSDDITATEVQALDNLARISPANLELAKQILSSSRFEVESNALSTLRRSALRDPELVSYLSEYAISESGGVGGLVLAGINHILKAMKQRDNWNYDLDLEDPWWSRLLSQPWFTDGLNKEELVLIGALSFISHPQLYNDLVQTPFTRSSTMSLPLAGNVNLWIFQPKPFHHSQEDMLPMLEDSVRIMEEFMGVPFPVSDVILVIPIIGPEVDHGIGGGAHWGRYITVTRYETSPLHDIWQVTNRELYTTRLLTTTLKVNSALPGS